MRKIAILTFTALILSTLAPLFAKEHLPQSITFVGEKKYRSIMAKAKSGQWHTLSIGQRILRIAMELRGTAYKGYTLEIHDKIESPSVNFEGLDCWTFFETALCLARSIEGGRYNPDPSLLLKNIEYTRYRGGTCGGNYLERIHYLAEWFFENEARGVADDFTRTLPGAKKMVNRECCEMTKLWKSYRYLRNNPSLLPGMAAQEARVSKLSVYYIPKDRVKAIEARLQDGDVIGIVTKYQGGFCSHVGLAHRTKDGVLRFMHASTTYKKVVVDKSISDYLNSFSKHAGIIVARPLPLR